MGILSTSRTFAGTIGIALIGLFLNAMQAKYSSEGAHDATIASFSTTHYALAVCLIITFALSFFLHHRKSTHNLPPSSAEGWD